MALAEEIITSRYHISAYQQNQVTINERPYGQSLVLSPQELIEPWPVASIADLTPSHLEPIFDLKPDVILLGSGEKQVFPATEILGAFACMGYGVEVMNTGALCRTFNILVAEDRNVVAGIIL